MLRIWCVIALIGVWLATAPAHSARQLTGMPERIHDGDTLRLAGVSVRLWGIDAPELKQRCQDGTGQGYACGEVARDALITMIRGKPVTCHERDVDRYARVVAACEAGGVDLNRELVRQGWAVAYTTFTRAYVSAEAAARMRGVGIWGGRFQMPAAWRRDQRR